MDIDITKMFENKNKEIFINSLTLEMERNLDTLKTSTNNIVALEINKLIVFFKDFFKEYEVDYTKEELIGFLYKEKIELDNIVNERIEEKKKNIRDVFFKEEVPEKIITDKFIERYFDKLKEETELLNSDLDIKLKDKICIEFSEELSKRLKLSKPEAKERLNSRINILFKNSIISRICDESYFRDESLKNFTNESFKKYVDLNRQTINKTDNTND